MAGFRKHKNILISHFKRSSIFMSHLKRFFTIIVIPLAILVLILTVYYYRAVSLESKTSSSQIFASAKSKIETLYNSTEEIYLSLLLENGFPVFMNTSGIPELDEYGIRSVNSLVGITKKYCTPSSGISSIAIYSKKADYVLSTEGNGPSKDFSFTPWKDIPSDKYCYYIKNGNTMCLCYNVASNNEELGLVIFTINGSQLRSLATDPSGRNVSLTLIDGEKNVFFSTGEISGFNPKYNLEDEEVHLRMYNKHTEITSKVYDVYLHMAFEHSQPFYSNFILLAILFILAVALLSVAVAYLLASFSYKTVQEIVKNVNEADPLNDFSDSANEIMYINQNILSMKSQNKKLEEELLSSFANLKVLQTQVLQSQFTPHFLFNALNTLNLSLMLKNGVDNPESKTLISLSELLEESIDTKNYTIELSKELEYCEKYIKIQSYMSNNNFDVIWDIDEETKNCMYIKFTLQPLIENAFKHGIKYVKKKRGVLVISAKKENGLLKITIKNNGPSPTMEEMEKINSLLYEGVSNNKNHVGLFNVNKRVKLVFGDDYYCKMSVEDEFTLVTVTTPFVTDFNVM